MSATTIPLQLRLRRRTNKHGPVVSRKLGHCWLWLGSKDKDGYGKIRMGGRTGALKKTHRTVWEFTYGKIPDGLCVCHKCDNRSCIRPSHLFLGTSKENTDDRTKKGRSASGDRNGSRRYPERLLRGENHAKAKLNDGLVLQIRHRYHHKKETQTSIALDLGVSQKLISCVVTGKIWTHIQ